MKIRTNYSVLITDDDEGCRVSLQSILDEQGYRTYLASDGFEAMRIVRREYIDVVIFDVHLPGMTGPETWVRIREEQARQYPCVFITGDAQEARNLEALSDPACAVVTKPLNRDRVIQALEAMIRKYRRAMRSGWTKMGMESPER